MIIIGLGSNLGDKAQNLRSAIDLLSERLLVGIQESSVITTKALTPEGAPKEWDIDFSNMVLSGELKNEISPQEFLQEIKNIESELGREPSARWAPRIIDIDILAWNDEVIDSAELQIPHIGIVERDFVCKPLLEIVPNWVHPIYAKKLSEIITG